MRAITDLFIKKPVLALVVNLVILLVGAVDAARPHLPSRP